MTGKEKLINFKKMWTWLSGYPAHDREYYMKNVAELDKMWINACPLSDAAGDDCGGCAMIWKSDKGTMCTDMASPLYKWTNTSRDNPDFRSFYASQVAVLSMKALRNNDAEGPDEMYAGSDYSHSQLHG